MSNFCSCGYSISYSFILEPVRKYLNGFSYNCLGEFTIYDCVPEAKAFTCSVRKEREWERVMEGGREGGRQTEWESFFHQLRTSIKKEARKIRINLRVRLVFCHRLSMNRHSCERCLRLRRDRWRPCMASIHRAGHTHHTVCKLSTALLIIIALRARPPYSMWQMQPDKYSKFWLGSGFFFFLRTLFCRPGAMEREKQSERNRLIEIPRSKHQKHGTNLLLLLILLFVYSLYKTTLAVLTNLHQRRRERKRDKRDGREGEWSVNRG